VVVTATGEQRRIEVGNSIAQVNASEIVETRAVSNMADLLTARAAGVQVIPGTQTGAGVRVRIRGNSSLSLSNNPIYIIDGVRVEGTTGSMSVSVGGTTPARINDINPDEIESIEIVRGPSAIDAVRHRRGEWRDRDPHEARRGRPYRSGRTTRNRRPSRTGTTTRRLVPRLDDRLDAVEHDAVLPDQAVSGACVQDSVTSFNVTADPETTPFGTGYRQQHGLQLRGGSEAVRFFLHGEWEDENGPAKDPGFRSALARPQQHHAAFRAAPAERHVPRHGSGEHGHRPDAARGCFHQHGLHLAGPAADPQR
jgi:hypothetical protein